MCGREARRLIFRKELPMCARNSIDLTEITLGIIHTLVITGATDREKNQQENMWKKREKNRWRVKLSEKQHWGAETSKRTIREEESQNDGMRQPRKEFKVREFWDIQVGKNWKAAPAEGWADTKGKGLLPKQSVCRSGRHSTSTDAEVLIRWAVRRDEWTRWAGTRVFHSVIWPRPSKDFE